MRYMLRPLTHEEAVRWDEWIAPYGSRQLFHRKAWLDYLAATRGLAIRCWEIQDRGRTVGYFCGGVLRKGPFRILGSPLRGWGTNFMGPVADGGFDSSAFLRALDELAEREKFAMVEIESPILPDDVHAAFGYTPVPEPTYVVELTPGEPERMWKRLKQRENVRKAIRLGLRVEETEDPSITEEFYDQFVEVLARKNLYPPYEPSCAQLLFDFLRPKGLLFSLRVRDTEGNVIGTGLFPHDDTAVYFWGGASRIAAWDLCPNDLLQWKLMEMAAGQGLRTYNMCGYGFFKSKFGGVLQERKRWHKCYSRSARWARRGYALYFEKRIRLRGWWERAVRGKGD